MSNHSTSPSSLSHSSFHSSSSSSFPVRVRFAPSPTGNLHIGGARTALYSYLFSKSKKEGVFVLRVEDTDLERSSEKSLERQLEDLTWLGLHWDEGPLLSETSEINGVNKASNKGESQRKEEKKEKGNFGPYRQSQRLSLYHQKAEKLLNQGKAYYCFLTEKEWDKKKAKAKEKETPFLAKSPYRDVPLQESLKEIEKGKRGTIRFKNDFEKDFVLKDIVRGEVRFPSNMVGDFVLIRSNGMPVYNFCCTVDDFLMKITHVFRAEEHLSNTLRQMMIYEALSYPLPKFGHFSLVLGSDRKKLSKRHGAHSIDDYRKSGYLPEALNNFMALLGWSSPEAKEILTLEELIQQFSLDRLNPASAIFDEKRLLWVNASHLRGLSSEDLWQRLDPFLKEEDLHLPLDKAWREKALNLLKTSMETLKSGAKLFRPFSNSSKPWTFTPTEEAQNVLLWESTKPLLEMWKDFLEKEKEEFLIKEKFLEIQKSIQESLQIKGKKLFMPLRLSTIGEIHGAELKELIPLLPCKELLRRVSYLVDL